jgi:glycosyltransferase involved in cell wall biosynthesis
MRIALVTREYPPETGWGGIGAFYAAFARSLAEAGHEVEVFAQGLVQAEVTDDEGVRVARVLGQADGFGSRSRGPLAGNDDLGLFALGLARSMHEAVRQRHADAPFDVIESHEHLGIGALINADPDLKPLSVTRYHAAYHSLVKRALVDWPESRLVEALERAAITGAAQRISVSASIDQVTVEDFGAPPADTVIPNFVRAPDWTGRWSDKKDQILFVGRLVLNLKRPDLAVEAFVRFAETRPGWTLKLVGLDQDHEGVGSVWKHLQKTLPVAMRDRVEHLGGQEPEAVYRLMAESKAMLMPSEFESFGLVVVEAMMHGCLPLVTRGAATADVVPDTRLIRTRGSAEDFADGLEALLGDEGLSGAAALSSRVVDHARDAFSRERIVGENLGAFDRAVAARRRKGRRPAVRAEEGPLVSVMVPNFNGARFLDESLRSIVTQDYPNLEVILVDGGSTDDSLAIAAAWPTVQVIRQPDKGQAHAINRGLLRARGDILAYLNSDDVYRPGAIRAVVAHFQARPDARLICGAADYIGEDSQVIGKLIQPRFSGLDGVIRYWGWDRWHTIPQMSCFWRREVVERVGLFDASLHYVMDLDYWIRSARLFDIVTVPETLAAFRLVAGTKTVSATDRMYAEEYATFRRYRHLLPLGRRITASWAAKAHYSGKLLGFAEHLYLTERLRRLGVAMALETVKVSPLRLLDPRVWMIAVNVVASAARLGGLADRAHRRALAILARLKGG